MDPHSWTSGPSASAQDQEPLEMENIAKTMSEDEIKEVARYFSSIKVPQ